MRSRIFHFFSQQKATYHGIQHRYRRRDGSGGARNSFSARVEKFSRRGTASARVGAQRGQDGRFRREILDDPGSDAGVVRGAGFRDFLRRRKHFQGVGAGSGLDSAGIKHKYEVLKQALDNYKGDRSPLDVARYFGGYEMVMAVGGMLRAAELKMIILVDGFIMTNCVLLASKLYPEMLEYCVFGHCGDEAGHKRVLDYLGAKPLLSLGLRLGEGSGAVCAYPILDSAVRMINEMHSFKQASITKYF